MKKYILQFSKALMVICLTFIPLYTIAMTDVQPENQSPANTSTEKLFRNSLPVYFLILWGNFEQPLEAEQPIQGEITITGGQFTLGRDFLINADEQLTSKNGDTGAKIEHLAFSTKTKAFKGVLLRVFPEQESGKLIITVNNQTTEVALSGLRNAKINKDLSDTVSLKTYNLQTQLFNSGLETEKAFAPKLEVLRSLTNLEKWMVEKYSNEQIDDFGLNIWRLVLEQGLNQNYKLEDAAYFRRRMVRLAHTVNNDKLTPRQLLIGVKRLVEKGR